MVSTESSGFELTSEEVGLLRSYSALPTNPSSHWNRLAVEIVPPLMFIGLWAFTGHATYLMFLILALVGYNVLRVSRQRRNIHILKSLATKLLARDGKG
ncbi:MAG: hypothetical protein RL318_721 [Fibrobacterota bacterium]|jgi:hypothetical protein